MDEGMQIKELAQNVGVDEMTIFNWENDRTKPLPENQRTLRQKLKWSSI